MRIPKRQTQCSCVPQPKRGCEDGGARRRLSVRQTTTDSNISTNLLKSQNTAKDMGTLGFGDSDVKSLLLLNRVFRVGVDRTGRYLDIEHDLRHAPLIISESGCNTNTEAVNTPREKLQDKLVLDGRRSPILKKYEATRYKSACMKLSYLAQDRLDLAETAKHLARE